MLSKIIKLFKHTSFYFFCPPKKIPIVFLASDPFLQKYFISEFCYDILNPRDKVNLFIFARMILNGKLSFRWYYATYINYIAPKFVINCAGDPSFMCIPPLLTCKAKTIFVETSLWNPMELEVISLLDNSYPKAVDYLFCVSQARGEMLQKYLTKSTSIIPLGSIKGNTIEILAHPSTNTLSFISQVMNPSCLTLIDPAVSGIKKISWEDKNKYNMHKADGLVAKYLATFCKQNGLKFQILGRHSHPNLAKNEKDFFLSYIDEDDFVFFPNLEPLNSYKKCENSNIVVTIDSTLGLELLGKGKKVAFFSCRGEIMNVDNGPYFGWPDPFVSDGDFFCNGYDEQKFDRILVFLLNVSTNEWRKIQKKHMRHSSSFSPNNQVFLDFCRENNLPLKKEYL